MKDFIVLIATIILGVVLAAAIMWLGDKGDTLKNTAGGQIDDFVNGL